MTDATEDLTAFFDLIDYPYYVVTVRSPDADMSGCLVGFVTQCSIDPPNFLVCISKVNHTLTVAEHSPGMGLHLLGEDQVDLARLFGEETGDVVDKFASVDWRLGTTGGVPHPSRALGRRRPRWVAHLPGRSVNKTRPSRLRHRLLAMWPQ